MPFFVAFFVAFFIVMMSGCMSIDNSTTYRLDRAVVSGDVDLDTTNDIDTAKDAAVTDPDNGGNVMTGEGSDAITPDFSGLVGAASGAAGDAVSGLGNILRRDDKDDDTLPQIVDELYTEPDSSVDPEEMLRELFDEEGNFRGGLFNE